MQSPTALTPEPTDPNSSVDSSSASFESVSLSSQQISISLSSSPLTVRSNEEHPFNSRYVARKALQDILEDIDSTNNTPNKVTANETPLRATPLLTPPSSDERPQATFISINSLSSPLTKAPTKQTPLTEKILAQSALYSRAIQKQQKQSLPASSASTGKANVPDPGGKDLFDPAADWQQQLQQQSQPIPQLTYSQLQQQQQQQFFNRQLLNNNPDGHKDSLDHNTKDNHPINDSHSLTAVELPIGVDIKATEAHAAGNDGDGSKQIAMIPKPDPLENPLRTTNVYINGLPLRWTDDDLYRLTRGFGAVKSVKLFTRHLEDKPSAYGFVLFNCVEDAERFITTLRQHTQFHPSFAKTAKVPGTTNAKHAISDPVIPLPRDEDYADISITGLPLTIDMQTLRALFAPQVIKTSKFFHTAGTPRRLVGFIRLEGQQAAQDVIERLHGSNVLGWTENLIVQSLGIVDDSVPYSDGFSAFAAPAFTQGQDLMVSQTDTTASSDQTTSMQTPSIGVYQHQGVQIDDVNRLLGIMNMSTTPKSIGQQEQSRAQPHSAVGIIPQVTQSDHSPYTPTFDLTHPHNLLPAISNSPQFFYSSNTSNRSGLGIGLPSAASPLYGAAYNPISLQHHLPTHNLTQGHQTQFHGAFDSSQTLQALQAAVAAQDGVFGDVHPGPSVNAFGARQLVQPHSETPWSVMGDDNLAPLAGGSPIHQLHRVPSGSPFNNATRFGGSSAVGPGLYRHGLKFPLFPLSTSGPAIVQVPFKALSKQGGGVPTLLPALAPSSPQASSEESSPVTPTFPQIPRGIVSGPEADA